MGLIGLEHVSATKGSEDTEDREEDRERLATGHATLCKAFGDVVHRAA